MQFIKWKKQADNTEDVSIIWNNAYKAYEVIGGETIGSIFFENHEQIKDLLKNGFSTEVLAELKLNGLDKDKIYINRYSIAGSGEAYSHGNFYGTILEYYNQKNELPYGVFNMRYGPNRETLFKPYTKNNDKVPLIKNKNLKELVLDFFNNKVETGRKDKLGILLFGNPGNGKSTEVMELFDICQENKMRIFIIDSGFNLNAFQDLRHLLSVDNCVFVLEEVTERLSRGVEEILTFLDGENSWSNSITIATTNYPEDMPANLIDRPGRFEQFIEYGNPTKAEIIELGKAFGFSEDESSCLAGQGLSFDYVSFILSKAKKLGKSVKESRTEEEEKRKRLSATFKGKMGI